MVNVEISGGSEVYMALLRAGIKNTYIRATMGGYQVSIYNVEQMAIVAKVCQELGVIS